LRQVNDGNFLKYGDIGGVTDIYKGGNSSASQGWFIGAVANRVELNRYGEIEMKRLIASVLLSIALITSGAVVTQSSLVGTAYADDSGGDSGDSE
jgi:hypothetical protein